MTDVPHIATPPPGPRTREILERTEARCCTAGSPRRWDRSSSAASPAIEIEDIDGNVYLDCVSAMASVPVGAARADITDAAVEALRRYGNEDTHYFSHEFVLPLAERLLAIAPGALSRVDIALNGTEAVETAIRFMRRATGRSIVIGFMGGYHGETGTAGAVGAETSDLSVRLSGADARVRARAVSEPVPDAVRARGPAAPATAPSTTSATTFCFHAIDPREVAGFLIEPVMGSGGCVAPAGRVLAGACSTLPRVRLPAWRSTRSRPGSDAPGTCSRWSAGAWSPT